MLDQLDQDEANSIKKSQRLLKSTKIPADLAFIQGHLSFLPSTIKRLEENGLLLTSAMDILDNVEKNLGNISGDTGEKLRTKFKAVLARNPGYKTIKSVSEVLKGSGEPVPPGMTPEDVAQLKFCPVVTADVERTFSKYKLVLSDRRMNLTEDNLSKMMVVNWFYNRKNM